jgi:hypothetical protein
MALSSHPTFCACAKPLTDNKESARIITVILIQMNLYSEDKIIEF